ncbi:hypothetical protein BUE80_DR012722 [Diplocarpon rosae]|nr:hypothetical protein BUE80_DR012722 [Diplocarpon rosae]
MGIGQSGAADVELERPVSQRENAYDLDEKAKIADYKAGAVAAEDAEHKMTVLEAVRAYPMASFWAFVMSCTIIMESYDVFLIGNFVALPAFKKEFGILHDGEYVIQTKWQSARVGYRYATLLGLMTLNAFIFVFYFAKSLPIIFLAQILEGLPWGIFIANAPAYCSEIVPIKLRAPATQMLQMFWAIGSIIVGAVTYVYNEDPEAGIGDNLAFALGLITSALQMIFVMLSWILTTYLGRRTIYLWGSAINVGFLICLGIAASVGVSNAASLAQASLGLIVSVLFTLGPAPASWVIIGETSSIRLRPLTTGAGRASYYIVEIPCIFLASWMLNPTGANLGGRCGYVWASTGLVCLVTAYFYLPEMKGRSYREIDILFTRKVPARQWKKTVIDVEDDA